ncbi:MAG: hypothetical protein KJ886_04095, partial [Candidatus Thermoplasmatota archaeon]|nr:hypothetical protein [Candidatus Thermoplasmatota archaeon]
MNFILFKIFGENVGYKGIPDNKLFLPKTHLTIYDIVKVGERGQIVIPTKIRKKEEIFSGGYLR